MTPPVLADLAASTMPLRVPSVIGKPVALRMRTKHRAECTVVPKKATTTTSKAVFGKSCAAETQPNTPAHRVTRFLPAIGIEHLVACGVLGQARGWMRRHASSNLDVNGRQDTIFTLLSLTRNS
eukprot:TRINITY_DN12106_c0_g1_i4.p1 TRINITY_DN12106_c0_g1~~TRINITY_DN12106_c0_g1_i4.p1  ORF type:complete len:145 (+),score=6.81 TRINITY_DN12106_c0_g1_i4:64-435(+)